MNETMMRQWTMLRTIPRHPRRVDTPTIHARLCDQGITVSLRTVQRDLMSLATAFPLDFDHSKPQGWCWRQGSGHLEIPSMDAHTALTFNLVEQYMQHLLPRSTLSHMESWFEAAKGVANSQASSITQWQNKLRVIPHTLHKIPAPIDSEIQATIYNGLFKQQQIEVTYRAITGQTAKTYPVHPLAIVAMEQVIYLVCTVKSYQDPRFLAFHRIESAQLLKLSSTQPIAFDLDEFISRELGIRVGHTPLDLVFRIRGVMAKYLAETPISPNQTMTPINLEWTQVQVKVQDTVQLRTWLRSIGNDVVVEEPQFLRQQFQQELNELAALYTEHESSMTSVSAS